jgi:hypothetical protein
MATMTNDELIADERAKAEALEAELAERRDAAASARAALDQLDAREPDERSGRQGEHTARWVKERDAAIRRHHEAVDGLADLERRVREATGWARELEQRRVPRFDDQIAKARARQAEIPSAIAGTVAEARTLEDRLVRLDVAASLGDAVPDGEPSRSTAALARIRAVGADLEAERIRLDLRVDALLARRQSAVVEMVDVERQRIAERWAALAGEALVGATRLHAIAIELEQLDADHSAAGTRHGLPGGRLDTVEDQRWDPDGLERSIVVVARGLALRDSAG